MTWEETRARLAAKSTVSGTWGDPADGPWCVKREADIRAALERDEQGHAACVRHGCGCNDAGATRVECPEHAALRQRVEELEQSVTHWKEQATSVASCHLAALERAEAAEANLARVVGLEREIRERDHGIARLEEWGRGLTARAEASEAKLAKVERERDAALVHGPEDLIRALEAAEAERDEARAEVARKDGLILAWDDAPLTAADEACDALTTEARRIRAALAAAKGGVMDPLDREHTTSCGHTWTMRHTACPECFAALRQRVEELETELARPKHEVLRQLADAVERYGLMKQRAEAAEAKLERVVEVLLANRDSADRCLNEPNHPAWVHAQAHATISVCDTVLAAAKGEE